MDYPLYATFLLKAHRNNDITIEELLFLKDGMQRFMVYIAQAQKMKEISSEYDAKFIVYSMSQVLLGLRSYIEESSGLNIDGVMSTQDIDDLHVNVIFDQVINFFENGFHT